MRILKPVYGKESRKEERISRLEVQYLMAQFPLYEKHNWLYGSIKMCIRDRSPRSLATAVTVTAAGRSILAIAVIMVIIINVMHIAHLTF